MRPAIVLLVLAGGLGTRLRSVSGERPKAMMNLGGAPMIYWKLLEAKVQGFSKIYLSVGYKSDLIQEYISSTSFDGLEINLVRDKYPGQGTAAAVRQVLSEVEADCVCITYADSLNFCRRDLVDSLSRSPITTITFSRFVSPGSRPNVEKLRNGRVLYGESASKPKYVEHGLISLKSADFGMLQVSSSLPNALAELSNQGQLAGIEVRNRFWEIGTPESYHEASERLERREHEWFFQGIS